MKAKTFSFRQIISVMMTLLLLFTQAVPSASASEAVFTCGAAAEMLCIHADAYRSPALTAEEILGDENPDAPLTRMTGCEMLLRAFGPLPDVQEGVRYLIKYRDYAFTDVPEEGRAAVENLTNAGLYIPEDNVVFGPDEPMTEHELWLLTDRIHAYLQSSPKDDFYSWATAALLNDPDFLNVRTDADYYAGHTVDLSVIKEWIMSMLNDCLEHPDTPENANIAAFFSTYTDQEARENSMALIQPMIDALWNASDFTELVNTCADISRETGIELLLSDFSWNAWNIDDITLDDRNRPVPVFWLSAFLGGKDLADLQPGSYTHDAFVEQNVRLLSSIGIGQEEAEAACINYMKGYWYEGQRQYNTAGPGEKEILMDPEDAPDELSSFPWAAYLERAGYPGDRPVSIGDLTGMSIALSLMNKPENLPGIKAVLVRRLILELESIVPNRIRDRVNGLWDDFFVADPSLIFLQENLIKYVMPMIQKDVFMRFAKSEEYAVWHERLSVYCQSILADYRDMLEQTSWLNEVTRSRAMEKLDTMQFRLLIPTDIANFFQVDYVSAEEGGTLYDNTTRYLKARREWIFRSEDASDPVTLLSVSGNCWQSSFYYTWLENMFVLPLVYLVSNGIVDDMPFEKSMVRFGFCIAHEISHAFDLNGSMWNEKGEPEDWWTVEDREELTARCDRLAAYMGGYEFFPGFAVTDGRQIVQETMADLTALNCMMNIAEKTMDFHYRRFFEEFADFNSISATRRSAEHYLLYNEHPIGRCRVNRLLSLIDEFYETYDIQPGDAMYVAPEDRPHVF